jgi:LemA protein
MKKILQWFSAGVIALSLTGCGYNGIQRLDEEVKASQSQVLSVYKKRADLIPNIVEAVKGEATFEKSTLESVVNARAKATQVTPPENATPEQMEAFMKAQKELGSGLGRLLAVSENYPNLKSNAGFADLRKQLGEVEAQATAARNKYIRSIRNYNTHVRQFPVNLTAAVFGYGQKPQMQFEDEAELKKAPQVKF